MIKFAIACLLVFVSLFTVSLAIPYSTVSAQDAGEAVCDTLGQASGRSCDANGSTGSTISTAIKGALNLLSFVAGVATVIMVIIGGVKYITSQGDSASVSSAKKTVLFALIGIVIVALSQTIIFFFIDSTTSAPDTTQPQQVTCPPGEVCRQ